MIRVAAFTASRDDPSSRFRLRQFFEPLRQLDIGTTEFRPWISKFAKAPLQITGLGLLSRAVGTLSARNHDIAWLNTQASFALPCFEVGRSVNIVIANTQAFKVYHDPWMLRRVYPSVPTFAMLLLATSIATRL